MLLSGLAGCGSAVEIDAPRLRGADADRCRALVADLPEQVAGLQRREVEPTDAAGAAYGDPAVTVVCGGAMPPGFDRFSSCLEVNGVGWYVPEGQVHDPSSGQDVPTATLGTISHHPTVAVRVPGEQGPEVMAAVLARLAPAIKEHLRGDRPCV